MCTKSAVKDVVAGGLFGVGLAMGVLPILVASLLVRQNLFVVAIDRMDGFWKERQAAQ